jgi:hypothetical protein
MIEKALSTLNSLDTEDESEKSANYLALGFHNSKYNHVGE